jgi:hypothetical protein
MSETPIGKVQAIIIDLVKILVKFNEQIYVSLEKYISQ